MNAKIYYLLQELKDNFSEKLLEETHECLRNEIQNFNDNSEKSKELLNGQSKEFYYKIASDFIIDIQDFPLMYFLSWQDKFDHFSKNTMKLFFELCLSIDDNSDATDYINGIIELENCRPEIALFHFNRIDSLISCYFIGLCYLELENYENAIKNNVLFFECLEDCISKFLEKGMDLRENSTYKVLKWSLHNDLGYLYNRISEFEKAKNEYQKSLEICDLEDNFEVNFESSKDDDIDEFTIFVNNYLLALEKTREYSECINLLNFIITKFPNDIFYKNQIVKFVEKQNNSTFVDDIINNLLKVKKPFNLNSFQETKLISKEKILEDMIVEQIKYGFKVFGKQLEIYQDDEIFGRQYYIQSVNGILDLLLIDKSNNILYVVELKRNEAGIEVVEQIENYIEGLTSQLKREVKGIISLHKPDKYLIELIKTKSNIELYTYEFQFKNVE